MKKVKVVEVDPEEAITPQDLVRADELARTNPLIEALWLAEPHKDESDV